MANVDPLPAASPEEEEWIVGTFRDEQMLLAAIRRVRAAGLAIHDVFTPYPVHGLDEALALRRSRLGLATAAGGIAGVAGAAGLQVYCAVTDWPLNVGGKPAAFHLAFVPITFELGVLAAGLVTVAAFLWRSRLLPDLPHRPRRRRFTPEVTADRFVLVVERETPGDRGWVQRLLLAAGAERVRTEPAAP
jgi:hypothetical protein